MEGTSTCSPAAAVPVRTKIPVPIMAPMPRAVRLIHPSVFLSRFSGCSESETSWSMSLQRSSCDPTRALRSHPGKPEASLGWIRKFQGRACGSLYPETPRHATHCNARSSGSDLRGLDVFQLRVTLDKLFGSAARKTHGKTPVVIITLDAYNRANAVFGVAHLPSEKWICIAAVSCRRASECSRTLPAPPRCRGGRLLTTRATAEIFGGVRILAVRPVSPCLAANHPH